MSKIPKTTNLILNQVMENILSSRDSFNLKSMLGGLNNVYPIISKTINLITMKVNLQVFNQVFKKIIKK